MTETRTEIETACREVHELLVQLPIRTRPNEVEFQDGLYFFFEEGETSRHGPTDRVVRVGNHPRSDGGLVRRLRQHYSGNKNGSVFRKLLGGALLRSRDPDSPCLAPSPGMGHWELQNARPCARCRLLEPEVSSSLRAGFRFRCIEIPDRNERNLFEVMLVATLAQCPVCRPSGAWLGRHAYADPVRESGLWNVQFSDGRVLSKAALGRFAELVAASRRSGTRADG
jgi:hypothetical protein